MCIFDNFVFSDDNTDVYFRVNENTNCIMGGFLFSDDNTNLYYRVINNTNLYYHPKIQNCRRYTFAFLKTIFFGFWKYKMYFQRYLWFFIKLSKYFKLFKFTEMIKNYLKKRFSFHFYSYENTLLYFQNTKIKICPGKPRC